jgi:hypothetical protein
VPDRRVARFVVTLILAIALLSTVVGCTSGSDLTTPAPPPETAGGPTAVYLAVGGIETLNADRDDIQDNWPQIVFGEALPNGAVYVNLATDDATVSSALADQLPQAGPLHPTVASVWLEDADTRIATSPAAYRDALAQLVAGLRAAGATQVLLLTSGAGRAGPTGPFHDAVAQVASDTGARLVELGDTSGRADDAGQRRIADAVVAAMGAA